MKQLTLFDLFVIQHNDEQSYWNNDLGWCDCVYDANVYTETETKSYKLPMNGSWYRFSDLELL